MCGIGEGRSNPIEAISKRRTTLSSIDFKEIFEGEGNDVSVVKEEEVIAHREVVEYNNKKVNITTIYSNCSVRIPSCNSIRCAVRRITNSH